MVLTTSKMDLYNELMEFLEANNWLSLEDKDNASGVVKMYLKVYKPTKTIDMDGRKLYRVIWEKAIELGFQFNETDAHEMTIAVKNHLKNQLKQ